MRQPAFSSDWPHSWKKAYEYDKVEVFGDVSPRDLAYAYAYACRKKQTVRSVRRYIPTGSRILDVAAAQGNFSLLLAEMGYAVTWNDLRSELEGYVRLKHEHGTITYRSGNCFDLEPTVPFDAVLMTEIIEHVAHPDDFLRKIATLVRPGGWVVLTTPTGEYFRNSLPKFSECRDPAQYESVQFQPNADGHIFLLYIDEIKKLAEEAGLSVIDTLTYANVLTSGGMRTRHLLPWLPRRLVEIGERMTTTRSRFLRPLNTNTLAVLRRT